MLSKLHELTKNSNERLNWDDYFMSIDFQNSHCSRLNVHFNSVIFLGAPYLIHNA
jgi:hypothetical protein